MENEGGFGNWVQIPSSSSCSPFPDQFVVPPAGTTTSAAAAGSHHNHHYHHRFQHQAQAHHHLTCLKLGKRQYYAGDEPAPTGGGPAKITGGGGGGATKRERSSSACGMVPRCQVEGCNKALIDAKDYHRRHKVCEMHSKAPKVVVLGAEQRFCQQCSRFHAISEFDESKRSCRRRLAGHNERRRKSGGGGSVSIMRGPTAAATALGVGSRYPFLSQTSPGRALSLLSSKAYPWMPTAELASRSSAALRELIAENRAALLARQLFTNRSWHSGVYENIQSIISFGPHRDQATAQGTARDLNGWNQFQESGRGLTLDLMQSPTSASFEFLSRRNKSEEEEEEEECCEIWKSLEGTHIA